MPNYLTSDPKTVVTRNAPKGYTWRANGCAHIAIHYANNDQSWLAQELRTDGYPRLRLGLDKVTDPAELAAFRNDLDDDTWGAAPDAPDFIAWAN